VAVTGTDNRFVGGWHLSPHNYSTFRLKGAPTVTEYWWELEGWPSDLAPYVIMTRTFLDGRLTATEFEALFLVMFKRDTTQRSGNVFRILDSLFLDVDDYHPDASVRAQIGGLDDEELRSRAGAALNRLRNEIKPRT
jgi:hypothetical protein